MTIVIDQHPVFWAVLASTVMSLFVGGSIWVAAYSMWGARSNKTPDEVRRAVMGVVVAVFWLGFAVLWWRSWSPWAVVLTDNAVELQYLMSTRRIELADLERVEFELAQPGRRDERSIVRLSSGGRVYKVTQDPEPPGDLATRPVRRVFDQLARRLPPHVVKDVTE